MRDTDPYPPPSGCHEDADSVGLGENSRIHQTNHTTLTPFQESFANQTELSIVPGDRENDTHDRATPSFNFLPGQELGDYWSTPARESASAILDRVTPSYSYLPQHAPAVSADYPYDQPATNDRAGINYLAHRPVMQFPPVLDPDVATPEYEKSDLLESFSPAHYDPTVGRSNVEHQLPCATPAHSYGSCDREVPTFPDSGGTHWPYAMVMNSHQSPDNIRATPTIARETDAWGYPGPFVSHPSGGTGNEKMVQLPAGSLPVGTKYVESQLSNKRKQAMIPDGKRKAKRIRPGNPQRPNPRGLTQTPPITLPTRPGLRKVEQVLYRCLTGQEGWTPLPSIDFWVQGQEGMKLTDIKNQCFSSLDRRDDLMFTHDRIGNSVSCRMSFKGYPTCNKLRQIVTTNHKKVRGPITREKLAVIVAQRIECYLKELKDGGTSFHVRFENMFLVRLHNVSQASWQPEVWYEVSPSTSS